MTLSKKKQQVSRLAYMYAYLAVRITTSILYVVLRKMPEKKDTNAIGLRDAPLDIWGGGEFFFHLSEKTIFFFWRSTSDNFFFMFPSKK